MSFPSQPVEGQARNNHNNDAAAAGASVAACPNCRAEMPGQMRFCRMCGYRLGEGVAEYSETIRLQQPPGQQKKNAPRPFRTDSRESAASNSSNAYAQQPGSMPGSFRDVNAMAQGARQQALNQSRRILGQSRRACRHSWPHWFIWPIIGLTLSLASAGGHWVRRHAPQAPVISIGREIPMPQNPPLPPLPGDTEESFIGTNELKDAEGGASFESVTRGSAADRAGLVVGDIINSFDGHPIKNADQLSALLEHTRAGKTVSVVYTRGGKTLTTKLTTLTEEENDMLEEQSSARDEDQD
jgi:hypothetical protein